MDPNSPYNSPQQAAPMASPSTGMRNVCIRRIDVMSAGTMLGALYAFIGLIAGIIVASIAVLGAAAGGGGGQAAMGGLIGGVGALIIIPIFYGIVGFLGGIIIALLYNVVAGFAGGIRVDLEG